jgi:hypothetical protein
MDSHLARIVFRFRIGECHKSFTVICRAIPTQCHQCPSRSAAPTLLFIWLSFPMLLAFVAELASSARFLVCRVHRPSHDYCFARIGIHRNCPGQLIRWEFRYIDKRRRLGDPFGGPPEPAGIRLIALDDDGSRQLDLSQVIRLQNLQVLTERPTKRVEGTCDADVDPFRHEDTPALVPLRRHRASYIRALALTHVGWPHQTGEYPGHAHGKKGQS